MNDYGTEYMKSIALSNDAADDAFFNVGIQAPLEPSKSTSTEPAEPKQEQGIEEEKGFMDSVGTFIKELPAQITGGLFDAVNNAVDAARDVGESVGIPNYALQITSETGEFDPMFLSAEEVETKGGLRDGLLPELEEAETAIGGITRSLVQFAAGFIPVSKGLKGAGMVNAFAKGMTAGAVADAVVMDPHQARLAAMLNEVPVLQNIVPDYIADNDPANESAWEGRMKNALEGGVLGVGSELVVGGTIRMLKAYKVMNAAKKAAGQSPMTPDELLKESAAAKDATSEAVEEMSNARTAQPEIVDDIPTRDKADILVDEFGKANPDLFDMGPEQVLSKRLKGGFEEGVEEFIGKQSDFYFNHSRVNAVEDVHEVLQNMANTKKFPGIARNKATAKASIEELKDISDLIGRDPDRPFTKNEAFAARELMLASGEAVAYLAKKSRGTGASPNDVFLYRRSVQVHRAVQDAVLSGRRASAQSTQIWAMPVGGKGVGSMQSRAAQIAELVSGSNSKAANAMADAIVETAEAGGNVSKTIGQLTGNKWANAHYMVWVNGLLSGPATQIRNVASNTATTLFSIPERYVAAGFEAMQGTGGEAIVAANAKATGFMSGIVDGLQLMTGKIKNIPLEQGSRIDYNIPDAISAKAWGKTPESTIGKGLDYLGRAIGLPGWSLAKGDMFFKGINYRMRVNEESAKTAYREGLRGTEFKVRVAELNLNPPAPIIDVAVGHARYQTFTHEVGSNARMIGKIIQNIPGGRYVMPFIKTPANILSYGFERTPLAPLMAKNREAFKAGGAERAEMLARMSAGSLLMASVAPSVLNGKVTGAGPSNFSEKRALELTGWRPYSVKLGDVYVSYEGMEPMSSLIGYSADVVSIMGQTDSEETGTLVAAGGVAFAKNITNKNYLSGMARFTEVVMSGSVSKWDSWASQLGAGIITPVYSNIAKKVGQYIDPQKRDYKSDPTTEWGFMRGMFGRASENIPGFGRDAPVLKDIWGNDQRYDHGVAPVLESISPVKMVRVDTDPVNNMIADNQIPLTLPARRIKGVKLSNNQYALYSERAGKLARMRVDNYYKSGGFTGLSGGPDGRIAMTIERILQKTRRQARGELISADPQLENDIFAMKEEQIMKLDGSFK